MTLTNSTASTNVQLNSPEPLQANIVAFYFFALFAGSPFGGLLSGFLTASGGIELALTVAGGAALGTCLIAAVCECRFRKVGLSHWSSRYDLTGPCT